MSRISVVRSAGAETLGPGHGQFLEYFSSCNCVTTALFSHLSEGYSTPQAPPQPSAGGLQVDFESVFGAKATGSSSLNSDGKDFTFK